MRRPGVLIWPWAYGALFSLLVLSSSPSQSLPSHNNLYQTRAGYRVNCEVCHGPQGGLLTPYAQEFLKLGHSATAMEALELIDTDQDGFSTAAEIMARSNPGDARSTPEHPGVWLEDLRPTPAPKKILSQIFGRDWTYGVAEKPLSRDKVEKAELLLREKLWDEDRYPTVFLIKKGEAVHGKAGYAVLGKEKLSIFLVVLGPDNSLRAVRAVRLEGDQRFSKAEYLKQFEGKKLERLRAVVAPRGAEARHMEVLSAVRRAMVVIELASQE